MYISKGFDIFPYKQFLSINLFVRITIRNKTKQYINLKINYIKIINLDFHLQFVSNPKSEQGFWCL